MPEFNMSKTKVPENKAQIIHIISDLHLCQSQPELFVHFQHFMQHIATASEQLYILGDFFEVWVGDDFEDDFTNQVIKLLHDYQGQLFIGHGNRDFLLGDVFASKVNGQMIPEPYNFIWQGKAICLLHGDSLCSDDISHQEMRKIVRNPAWQKDLLSKPLAERIAFAASLRQQSKASQKKKSAEIMDVNLQTVVESVIENQCDWLIHGHTHRPATHDVNAGDNGFKQRFVLSDWHTDKGHYLELKDGELKSLYFSG